MECNPMPLKWALHLLNLMSADLRLPLCVGSEKTRNAVAEALMQLNLIQLLLAANPFTAHAILAA
jgi:dihydrodipicolinate synthase/N-acetylneuraminate lyase